MEKYPERILFIYPRNIFIPDLNAFLDFLVNYQWAERTTTFSLLPINPILIFWWSKLRLVLLSLTF